jgi:hypothetical protein
LRTRNEKREWHHDCVTNDRDELHGPTDRSSRPPKANA